MFLPAKLSKWRTSTTAEALSLSDSLVVDILELVVTPLLLPSSKSRVTTTRGGSVKGRTPVSSAELGLLAKLVFWETAAGLLRS